MNLLNILLVSPIDIWLMSPISPSLLTPTRKDNEVRIYICAILCYSVVKWNLAFKFNQSKRYVVLFTFFPIYLQLSGEISRYIRWGIVCWTCLNLFIRRLIWTACIIIEQFLITLISFNSYWSVYIIIEYWSVFIVIVKLHYYWSVCTLIDQFTWSQRLESMSCTHWRLSLYNLITQY